MPELTPSQVKKAGRTIRHFFQGEADVDVATAIEILLAFRASHAGPLRSANMGLRSMVRTEGCEAQVSQRLKRVPTIIDKLMRERTLDLYRMQDLGGVRAILPCVPDIRRVQKRLTARRTPVAVSDYIAVPRSSGYRGVHAVVEYQDRRIEIQLRTPLMHQCAFTVERLSARVGQNLKGDGRHAVQNLMAAISQALALEEEGGTVGDDLVRQIDRLRTLAEPYLGPSRSAK